jgi:hypothetical protein
VARSRLGHLLLDHLAEVALDDRRAALVDEVDLRLLGIDADDLVAFVREATGAHRADVTEPRMRSSCAALPSETGRPAWAGDLTGVLRRASGMGRTD